MSICRKCGKNVEEELKVKTGWACKKCVSIYNKAYREANKSRISASKKAWKLANAEHVKQKDKQYADKYPERRAAARKKWIEANPDKDRAAKKRYTSSSLEKVRAARIAWELANPGCKQARCIKRRTSKNQRTPTWVTEDQLWMIKEAYKLAAMRSNLLGTQWHVDHIVPLQGKLVSGLHVPWNLQVIPAIDNLRKNNLYA